MPLTLEDQLSQLGRDRKAEAVMLVKSQAQAAEESDLVHADEKKYQVAIFFQVTGVSTQKRQKEVLDSENLGATRHPTSKNSD